MISQCASTAFLFTNLVARLLITLLNYCQEKGKTAIVKFTRKTDQDNSHTKKDKERDKEREKDRSKDKEKEKEKEKEREKEKDKGKRGRKKTRERRVKYSQ